MHTTAPDTIELVAAITKVLIISVILTATAAAPRRSPWIVAACLLGLAGQVLIVLGNSPIAAIIGIATWATIAYVFTRKLRQSPDTLWARIHEQDREIDRLRRNLAKSRNR